MSIRKFIQKNGKVIAVAVRNETQLYVLSFGLNSAEALTCATDDNLKLWHMRLGHLKYTSLRKLEDQVT